MAGGLVGAMSEVVPEWFRTLYEQAEDGFVLAGDDGRVLAANPAAVRMFGCAESELLAGGADLVFAPLDRRVEVARETGNGAGRSRIDVVYRRPDGTRFIASVSVSSFDGGAAGRMRWVMLRDVTARRRSEAVSIAITDIALSLLAGDPINTVLGSVVRHARRLVDAAAGWVVVVEEDGLGVPVVEGSRAQPLLGGHFSRASATLTARTFDEGTVSVTDLSEATAAPAGRALGLGPALTVRLAYGDRRFGVLVVAREQGRPEFSEEEREIVGRLANSASVALALETVRAEVAEHERANIGLQARHEAHVRALEMNDVIVQTLCAAKWKLEAGNTEQASDLLTEVIESAERIIAELLPPQVSVDSPVPPAPPGVPDRAPGPDNAKPARTPFDYTGWYLPAEER